MKINEIGDALSGLVSLFSFIYLVYFNITTRNRNRYDNLERTLHSFLSIRNHKIDNVRIYTKKGKEIRGIAAYDFLKRKIQDSDQTQEWIHNYNFEIESINSINNSIHQFIKSAPNTFRTQLEQVYRAATTEVDEFFLSLDDLHTQPNHRL